MTLDVFDRLLSKTVSGIDSRRSSQTGAGENSTRLLSLHFHQRVTLFVSLLITAFYKSDFFVRIDDNTSSSGGGGGGVCESEVWWWWWGRHGPASLHRSGLPIRANTYDTLDSPA